MMRYRLFLLSLILACTVGCQKKGGDEPAGAHGSGAGKDGAKSEGGGKKRGGGPQAVRVERIEARTLPIEINIVAPLIGRTQSEIYPKVTGRVSFIGPKEGEAVKVNQVLLRVDRSDPGESFLSTPVVSPSDGWVGRWIVNNIGEQVSPNAPVATIVDDRSLRALVYLPTREWVQVKPSTVASVHVGADQRSGKIIAIARAGDPASGRGSVLVEVANDDHLWRAGMVAKVTLGLSPKDRLVIPTSALMITESGAFVYIAKDGKAVRAAVEFQLVNSDRAEILSGLTSGIDLVVAGTNLLSDQAPIKVITEDKAG